MGDVAAALQAFEIGTFYAGTFPTNIKLAGLGGIANCQFRFFAPVKLTNGERWAFCEDEVFLGGNVWNFDYAAFGISRQDAIDELDYLESTVFFGPAAGAQPEQSLIRTGYKDYIHPEFGRTVATQEAFITQESPGTYVSSWTAFFAGEPIANVVVEIDVVSHTEHLHRVENGTWRTW